MWTSRVNRELRSLWADSCPAAWASEAPRAAIQKTAAMACDECRGDCEGSVTGDAKPVEMEFAGIRPGVLVDVPERRP